MRRTLTGTAANRGHWGAADGFGRTAATSVAAAALAVEQAVKQAAMATAVAATAGGFRRTSAHRGRGNAADRLGGAAAAGVDAAATAAIAVEQAMKQAMMATSAGRARITARMSNATRRLDGTATGGLCAATAAAKHASEQLERAGFRRAANEQCAGANHREDDSTTHEERS